MPNNQNLEVEFLFVNRKVNEISSYLTDHHALNIMDLTDAEGNTLLHQLAFQGYIDIIKLYVKHARRYLQSRGQKKGIYAKNLEQQITEWMNRKNNEGFTPLLYASYSGHMEVIKYLFEEHKVNQKLVTNSGLNPLHLAAQKNKVLPFLYFRDYFKIVEEDNAKSTPLHWAACTNSQQVTAFILSHKNVSCLDHRDSQGNTPLMLAVIYGNTRIVRRLLIRGANRYVKDIQGKTPLAVAIQNNYKTITKMLSQQFSYLDFLKLYCNIKIQYKPKRRKWTFPILFIIGLLLNLFIINFSLSFNENLYLIIEAIGFGLMFSVYLTLLGTAKPQYEKNYNQLLKIEQKKMKLACFQCKKLMPPRGYHCDICKVCVKQYDHHCTWINNCVGKKNLFRFILFLFLLVVCLAAVQILGVITSIKLLTGLDESYNSWFTFRYLPEDNLTKYITLALFVFTIISSIFLYPVILLLFVQLKNLVRNKTTYETIRGPSQEPSPNKEKLRKNNNKISLRNCKVMCSDNQTSSFTTVMSSSSNQQLITDKFQSQNIET